MHPDVLVDALKAEGLKVVKYTGWDRRCRCCPDTGPHRPDGPYVRGWGDVNGTVVHITAGNLGGRTVEQYIANIINGDPSTPVKSQFVTAPDGTVYVNSAGRANHAGRVGSTVQAHLRAADFSTSSDYDARFRGGTADGNAFTYGIENIAASSMTEAQRDASVRICAAIARHYGWTGQESVGHGEISSARVKADPNLDMGKFRRDVMARVKAGTGTASPVPEQPPVTEPCPDPAPEQPAPEPTTVKVRAMFTPFAGYNSRTALGVTRWKKNVDGGAAIILKHKPDLVGTTEVANKWYCKMRPRLDAAVKSLLIRVGGGSDGRYIYRNPSSTKYLFQKLVTTPDTRRLRLKHDDKQGHILGFEKDGVRGIFGVFHAENEQPFDEGRVNQALWFEDQVEALRKAWKIDPRNVLTVMDSNSESWVASKLKSLKYKVLRASSFVGWKRNENKDFDLSVTKGKGTAKEISSDGNSDHNFQVIDLELVK